MKSLDHPNIVKVFESHEDAKNIYITLEYLEQGTLDVYL